MERSQASNREFGKRREPHRVTIARNGYVRSFTISPWAAGLVSGVGALFAIGYIGATAYLVLRDDLIRTSTEKQAALQLTYEDRIANLRAQIDRLTSRRVLDKKSIEEKVDDLIVRQRDLDERQARVSALLEMAAKSGIKLSLSGQVPGRKPEAPVLAAGDPSGQDDTGIGGTNEPIEIAPALGLRGTTSAPIVVPADKRASAAAEDRENLFVQVNETLNRMDDEAHLALDVIAVSAEQDIETIEQTAGSLGLRLAGKPASAESGTGGPFEAFDDDAFDSRLERAERALADLERVKEAARGIPLSRPIEGAKISSSFGPRLDPFLRRLAMHTGIDLRAPGGTKVHASAPGKVVSAGRNGGYGLMVEIEHPSGLTSRYAHMRKLLVSEGEEVDTGDVLGLVGSTGRSTGPHLHYEIRVNGEATDPRRFVQAGKELASILDY
ncbi:M23 family metallopeptidase [Stappia sp. F7233]|uniref:M23 family metallopeptidase n=1 Tax=Stappia albiluteola TaxID=2758565 RepID=A0A839AAP5_9HYPH|nr:M23 family metallopeptidase [Stappia albiluteola]MBA5776481.1 M23 family metallopeptidase [Stappia albiluteola]